MYPPARHSPALLQDTVVIVVAAPGFREDRWRAVPQCPLTSEATNPSEGWKLAVVPSYPPARQFPGAVHEIAVTAASPPAFSAAILIALKTVPSTQLPETLLAWHDSEAPRGVCRG